MSTVTVDARGLLRRADLLGKVDAKSIGEGALRAVNSVATEFNKTAEQGALAGINLTSAYYRSKTDLRLGTSALEPEASITVAGGKPNGLTVMGRFPGTVAFVSPGARRRAGPVRGRRSAGVSVEIRKGERQLQPQWFVMKLRNQQGLVGVFVRDDRLSPSSTRDGVAGKRHIYGPGPYQLFRKQVEVGEQQLSRDLEREALINITAEIEKGLE